MDRNSFEIVSPTRYMARQYKKRNITNYGNFLKVWNPCFLVWSLIACSIISIISNISTRINGVISLVGIIIVYAICISRIVEIAVAFFYDAFDKLRGIKSDTNLRIDERIKLAIQSYLEISINFGIIYYFIPSSYYNKPFCGILDSVYFSIVTITTLGYGDIAPISIITRALCVIELVIGMGMIVFTLGVYMNKSNIPSA